jgi:hypothetical protein
MLAMSRKGYTLLGYVVWHGAKWYVRRRLPSPRVIAVSGVLACTGLAAAAVAIVRRASG